MSRYGDGDGGEEYNNATDLWRKTMELALLGKRGRKALGELREALLALPEKRLISRALCTVGVKEKLTRAAELHPTERHDLYPFFQLEELVEEQGPGVCAVGAYVWWKTMKANDMTPEQAFATMPVLADFDHDIDETVGAGQNYGLTFSLAWNLAYTNDETFGDLTPESRYERFLSWIDEQLAKPPLVGRPKLPSLELLAV